MNEFFDKYIDTPFRELDKDGNYFGCMMPAYLLYPNAFKFKPEGAFNDRYILVNMIKYCKKLEKASNFGDIVIIKNFGNYHFFVYVGDNKFVHMEKDKGLHYTRLTDYIKGKIIGIFRYEGD